MADEAKRKAQEALYAAIENQAETSVKAALSSSAKAALLRDLAEAYRLAAGGSMPDGTGSRAKPSGGAARPRKAAGSSGGRGRSEG
jgi:hypothetical protein